MHRLTTTIIAFIIASSSSLASEDEAWVDAMRRVHAGSTGQPGVLLHLGDSITYSMAYFAPLQYAAEAKMPTNVRRAERLLDRYLRKECYRWKGPEKGNDGGQTAAWAVKNIDRWIKELQPEVALIMFGSNDIRRGTIRSHEADLRELVQRCLDQGVVVILSTIPPMSGFEDKVAQAVSVQRRIAADFNVPLIDFYAHVINRRPSDWDGSLSQFESFGKWEVPTIISQDGVHPSNPARWKDDYSEEGLCRNGNVLRTYLSLMGYTEVIRSVVQKESAREKSILGASPTKPANLPEFIARSSSSRGLQESVQLISPPMQDWFPEAPPLPQPAGEIISVDTVEALFQAAERVEPGGTILIRDGLYRMPRTFVIRVNDVTIRGASDDRTDVVLDFDESSHHEGLTVSNCSGVTIANLTVANVRQNGIKIDSNRGVDRVTIYNVLSHNVWQRHIKGVRVPDQNGQPAFVEDCRVQYCMFYNDRPKRRGDEPWEDENPGMGFNYIGGVDAMCARGWVISDNVFTQIHGKSREARGAIFLWHNSTDCVIERNIILDCDAGICMGNSSARGERRHANGFQVRNNIVVRCTECNILAAHTRNCRVVHNTVHDPNTRTGRLMRAVHANDGLFVANNIFSGPRIVTNQSEGKIDIRQNLIRNVGSYFVDARKGDLHLKAIAVDAIDRASELADVVDDIDRQNRQQRRDLGADEFQRTETDR